MEIKEYREKYSKAFDLFSKLGISNSGSGYLSDLAFKGRSIDDIAISRPAFKLENLSSLYQCKNLTQEELLIFFERYIKLNHSSTILQDKARDDEYLTLAREVEKRRNNSI